MCSHIRAEMVDGVNQHRNAHHSNAAKRRRVEANFPGADAILAALKPGGCNRRRVGLRMEPGSGPPARHDVPIVAEGAVVGHVTSGCPSPTLGGCVAMGYVSTAEGSGAVKVPGSRVRLDIRGKLYDARVVRMPFVPSRYNSQPKQ